MYPELLLPTLAALLVTFLTPAPTVSPAPTPAPAPARASTWPVGARPPVVRGWSPPATAYGAGHRGVDLAAAAGSAVRAVAPGRVSFAGRVADRGVVAVELDGTGDPPLRTTYEPVRATVKKGDEVSAGDAVGFLERPTGHCPTSCLHWGLRRARTYLNPLTLLPPWLLRHGPSRLLPLYGPLPGPARPLLYGGPLARPPARFYAPGLSPGLPAAPWPRLPP
ncbi:peptidase M23 [Streptomyces venezuelae]|uniref:Peptidase M23 n=1 Tax=Streptomyces venezuelae TaxID=54571 RepID=A0A5P2BTL4_STRVZ|nr:M23 family metallopeptidase [Streptomyces venezuelae]QES33826.1 peptidase M23 [Streptomyces venezuelae]